MFKKVTPCLLFLALAGFTAAKEIRMSPDTDLKALLKDGVEPGDSIVLTDGTWKDAELRFEALNGTEENPIKISAESPGGVVLTGDASVHVSGEHVIISGLAFRNSSAQDVFEFRTESSKQARNCRVTECSFEQTESNGDKESRWMNLYGTNNRVDHCYFAGKLNRGTTLVVWVVENSGPHRIDHNHFGPRPKLGENGGETIRVGTSQVSELIGRTVVEENYFERCNGEAEVISNKSCENTYRYNLFSRCEGALTLRHGHRCIVDGNIFLGHEEERTGGVRIIGSDHRVTNNYFDGLRGDAERAAVSMMNGIPDGPLNGYAPVKNALVAHNTFVDCKVSIEFGIRTSKKMSATPTDCIVSHNAFLPGKWELFRVQSEPVNFTWLGNKYQSGKTRGAELVEIERVEIVLERGPDGILRPKGSSALETGLKTDVEIDIDGEPRGPGIAGCDDPSSSVTVRKLESSTGPAWRR